MPSFSFPFLFLSFIFLCFIFYLFFAICTSSLYSHQETRVAMVLVAAFFLLFYEFSRSALRGCRRRRGARPTLVGNTGAISNSRRKGERESETDRGLTGKLDRGVATHRPSPGACVRVDGSVAIRQLQRKRENGIELGR